MLRRAFSSVSGQSHKDLVWVLVNDGGPLAAVDQTAQQASAAGLRTMVIHSPESRGMETASNTGICASSSEFIVIHDDDDTWEADFLKTCVALLRSKPHYHGVATQCFKVEEAIENGDIRIKAKSPFNPGLRAAYLMEMAEENAFPPISFLYRRSVLDAIGLYDEELPVLGDWDFNLRFLERFDIAVIPEPYANYHHRIGTVDSGDRYGNSLYAGQGRHIEYDAIIRNRLLRRDLAAGKFGLGHLVSVGRRHISLRRLDDTLQRFVRAGSRLGLDRLLRRLR